MVSLQNSNQTVFRDNSQILSQYAIFLTEHPTKFYPIWPAYIKEPYFIYHNSDQFFFYLDGDDAELRAYLNIMTG